MMRFSAAVLCLGAILAHAGTHARLEELPLRAVSFHNGFWKPKLEVIRTKTIPHNLKMCEGRIRNFAQAAGVEKGPFRGHIFHDSDLVKVLEGVAYSIATHPDKDLEAQLERVVSLIARAQRPDGYCNSYFIMTGLDKRWKNLRSQHELYCAGHMFEAAVAHYEATGRRTFLDVARKFADHIASVFGPDKRHAVAGHPEIELALVKLWKATGEERYLRLAKFFVEEHGQAATHKLYGTYCQDHKPIRDQDEAVGHCVRAMYFYSAVADLAAITGDAGYKAALERLWRDVVERKMYVTGGIGVQGHGEGFAKPYFLPNYQAYCETCAAIGMALWNHRLLLLHGEGRFADVFERALYNGLLSGVSLDGVRFFYVNPLASRGNHHRRPWYGCACCPTNVARFFPQLGRFLYAVSPDRSEFWVVHYAASQATAEVAGGKLTVQQKTLYPWDGSVQLAVKAAPDRPFTLRLRIPGWCKGWSVRLNGQPLDGLKPEKGFLAIERRWRAGDVVELDFPMEIRRVYADPRVEADRGRVALMRGPIVFCLEDCDNEAPVDRIILPRDAKLRPRFRPDLLGGVMTIEGEALAWTLQARGGKPKAVLAKVPIRAIPYFAWDNRQPGGMVVWIAEDRSLVPKPGKLSLSALASPRASHCWHADTTAALNDGLLPKNSNDHSIPRFTWWDHRGTAEWVEYQFPKAMKVSKVEVYWFDDTGRGGCRLPLSWQVLWHDGKTWRPVQAKGPFVVAKDKFNVVAFEPVETRRLRLAVQLRKGFSSGILEWRVW